MEKEIHVARLGKWKTNHTQNQNLEFITRSALIKIEELKTFIKKAESQNADSIRFYFIRYDVDEEVQLAPGYKHKKESQYENSKSQQQTYAVHEESSGDAGAETDATNQQAQRNGYSKPEGCVFRDAGNGVTQGSIALVPAKNFRIDDKYVFSAEDIVQKSEITVLIPGMDRKGTGHCPPCDE